MDTTRYVLAVFLVVGLPPAVLYWFIIHPLARFWQRLGPRTTFTIVAALWVVMATGLSVSRDRWVGRDLGTLWVPMAAGLVLYVVSVWLTVVTRRHLSFRTLAGVPEVSTSESPGQLLHEGIYGVIRHPRYLSVIVGVFGFALLANHVGTYVMSVAVVPALYLVILLEERELLQRLGAPYSEYRSRVPMFLPGKRS